MLQYKIPQNVGLEDKIVGPFSLRQLIMIAVGGGISYVLFAITSKLYEMNVLEYIVISIPALIAVAAALIKINNITFTKYLLLVLEFAIKPKKRFWNHYGISALVAPDLTEKSDKKKGTEMLGMKNKQNVNLEDLTKILDSGGFDHVKKISHEDIDKANDDDLVTQAFFGNKKDDKTQNMYWRTKESQKKRIEILAKQSVIKPENIKKPSDKPVPDENKPSETVIKQPEITKKTTETAQNQVTEKKPSDKPIPVIKNPNANVENLQPNKKRKRRNRKSKKTSQPIRENTQINSIKKKEPVKLIPGKEYIKENTPQITADTPSKNKSKGEFHIADLQKGEIEINLD